MNAGRVVWAVDLLASAAAQKPMLALLDLWERGRRGAVAPVYVFHGRAHLTGPAARRAAERELAAGYARLLGGAPPPLLAPLKVLFSKDASLSGRVQALLDHAARTRAVAVALTTHARTGPARWVFGSFTETAALHARLPLLTLNPGAREIRALRRILFATDLRPGPDRAFDLVVALAQARGLALVLAHGSEFGHLHPEAAYGPPGGYADLEKRFVAVRRALLRRKADAARARGIVVEEAFLEEKGDVAAALLQAAAARRVQLIALAARSRPLEAAIGGSVTRKVIRAASCPVWAIH